MNISSRILTRTNEWTDHIFHLPVLVLMPHSGCNCRCVMCDIWKANKNKRILSEQEIRTLLPNLKRLRVKEIVLSGGEALMHPNLWSLIRILKETGCEITLLSTGLLLDKYADEIVEHCDSVIVSLDGNQEIHNEIRNIPRAFERLAEGVSAIKKLRPAFPISFSIDIRSTRRSFTSPSTPSNSLARAPRTPRMPSRIFSSTEPIWAMSSRMRG